MSSYVVATAGHVDHGKSALVNALTGMEPDRWAEERRRGLTIDLGFAWTDLPSGSQVAFVDVPGHERFLGNMLAGLGPAPVVCFVVAADEGWQQQSSDHRDAMAALGIRHGVIVLTRADLAEEGTEMVIDRVRAELGGTGLARAPAVVVSARTGAGLDQLREALDTVLATTPTPPENGRIRLWVDRSFTIPGAGTVVTGTLTAGTLAVGRKLQLLGSRGAEEVTVRGLHSRDRAHERLGPTSRVAVNLRAVPPDEVGRGDVLLSPGAWPTTDTLDTRRITGTAFTEAPAEPLLHLGTATVPARLRPFDADHARLLLDWAVPVVPGDRLVLRYPGSQAEFGGAEVLDVDPPELTRRGDATRHAARLATVPSGGDAGLEVIRHGAVTAEHLERLGLIGMAEPGARSGPDDAAPGTRQSLPEDVRAVGDWWVHAPVLTEWSRQLHTAVQQLTERDRLTAGLSRGAARDLLKLPDPALLEVVIAEAGLEDDGGHLRVPGTGRELGAAEDAVAAVERRLAAQPFLAPEADELTQLGLGTRELAAAERVGRLLRLAGGVVLGPEAPARAMRELARLPQPFTTSQARQALGTTRRVAIPLLEHLDGRGWTRRIDEGHRTVVR